MNLEQLNTYLEDRPYILWTTDDDGNLYLKHQQFDADEEKVKVGPAALKDLTAEALDQVLVAGRNVEHISRVTGYFSKIEGWNKGKRAELEDRQRVPIGN